MEQLGFVRKVVEDKAEVEVRRISGCGGNCSSCASCEVKHVTVFLKNNIGAKEGDLVEIKAMPKKVLKYTLIAYMVPFIMLVAGIVLGVSYFQSKGVESYEMYGFGVGMAFLAVSYLIIKLIDRYIGKKDETVMEMTRVLK
ncbi:MAG TPA: SoxR reducing system RseC family protein [Tissierellia bacterium]|nr:SoxR reducing system RseC family protein [Tissierellia bacterium]